jgi:PAS domain S-box-containing protein
MSPESIRQVVAEHDIPLWQQIAESSPDIFYVISPSGEFMEMNPRLSKLLRLPRERILGSCLSSYVDREQAGQTERAWREIAQRRCALRSTRTFRSAGGDPETYEVLETPLTRNGQVWGIAGIGREITQEVVLEHKLWDAMESRRAAVDFALRTSLGLVKGYVCTLSQNSVMDEQRRSRYVNILEEEIDHLAKIIEDILDVRRLENGEWEPEPEIIDLRECLKSAVEQCKDEAQRRDIDFSADLPEKMDPFYAPREAVVRILLNLVQNAVAYTLPSGRVAVFMHDHEAYVDVVVRDSGIGIPETEIPHLFDKYFRGKSSAAAPGQGTGMGLAISRMLIEAIGGRITVVSQVGKGSEFRAVFPRRPLDAQISNPTKSWTASSVTANELHRYEGDHYGQTL